MSKILIIGGTHGVEPQSTYYVEKLAEKLAAYAVVYRLDDSLNACKSKSPENQLEQSSEFCIIPALNPDGLRAGTRTNARGVDLNRNMPSANWKASSPLLPSGEPNPYYGGTEPASESETKFLLQVIERHQPQILVSFHTNHYVQNPNPPQVNLDILSENALGNWFSSKQHALEHNIAASEQQVLKRNQAGRDLAQQIAELMALPLTEDIGYATPGSLGSYAKDQAIPCITVEFADELDGATLWQQHGEKLANLLAKTA